MSFDPEDNPLKNVRVVVKEKHPIREMFEEIVNDSFWRSPAEKNYLEGLARTRAGNINTQKHEN